MMAEEIAEALNELSSEELDEFNSLIQREKDFPLILRGRLKAANTREAAKLLVATCSQECVKLTKTVLEKMNRTDLVPRLSDISSGTKGRQQPSLKQRVEKIASVTELLLETLTALSDEEFKTFNKVRQDHTGSTRSSSTISSMMLESELEDTALPQVTSMKTEMEVTALSWVTSMMLTDGQGALEMTKVVLQIMDRTDLVKRLSDSGSGPKKKHPVDERLSALIHKVATMKAVKELLLETLNDLSPRQLMKFQWLLQVMFFQSSLPCSSWRHLQWTDEANLVDMVVDMVVEMYGQRSVEVAKELFMEINRTDLALRLSETSSGSEAARSSAEAFGVNTTEGETHCVYEHWPALTQKVEKMASVTELLLETLTDLTDEELYRFGSHIPDMLLKKTDSKILVFAVVLTYGENSVKKTKNFLKDMKMTDLVKRLSKSSSGPRKKQSDEHRSALIQKVATMAAVKQLLLETLRHLSNNKFKKFKELLQLLVPQEELTSDRAETVDLMVRTYGQQSVEVTREVLKKMNMTNLLQKLSKPSPGLREKQSVAEQQSALSERAMTVAAVKRVLLETLKDLRCGELKELKLLLQFTYFMKGLPWSQLQWTDDADELVDVIVKNQQPVAVIREVLMDMNRIDLAERLSETSSGLKDYNPTISDKCAVLHMYDWSDAVKEPSKWSRVWQRHPSFSPRRAMVKFGFPLKTRCCVLIYKTDTSFHKLHVYLVPRDPVRIQEIDMMELAANGSRIRKPHPGRSLKMRDWFNLTAKIYDDDNSDYLRIRPKILRLIHKSTDPQFFEVFIENPDKDFLLSLTRENELRPVWTCLIRKDDYQSTDRKEMKWLSGRMQKEVTMALLKEKLECLSIEEFENFKQRLRETKMRKDPRISRQIMEMADKDDVVELMVERYGQQSVEVTIEVLMAMNRSLSRSSSKSSDEYTVRPPHITMIHRADVTVSPGPSRSLELEAGGSVLQASTDWTKLEPEVNSTGEDWTPTYSLQSEAGNFECSVSGLRWFCKEKVSFKYQFCTLKKHTEKMEKIQYLPAGPLMDIKVITGKFDEVYIPHWICIDENPTALDNFAVLHIDDDDGEVAVEKVSEVTSSHAKLSEPVFTRKMFMVKLGFKVDVSAKVLIYGTKTPFLTLHVYLIPPDPGVLQELDKNESLHRYRRFRMPHPKKPLKMSDWFTLTAELGGAEVYSDDLQLLHESIEPNFSLVFVRNPVTDLTLKLRKQNETQPLWTCTIPQEEYEHTYDPIHGNHFVDRYQVQLINRVHNIASILDQLLSQNVIQKGSYDEILAIPTTRDKMRKLYSGPLNAAGHAGKEIFYKILEKTEPFLIADLKENFW